ncbi:ribonuclease M5, partial [Pseudomonas sp. GW456-E7]
IRACLENVHEEMESQPSDISAEDLIHAGLIGGSAAKRRRERLGDLLKIGYTNGKQLQKRLQMFQIKKSDFMSALDTVKREEQNE